MYLFEKDISEFPRYYCVHLIERWNTSMGSPREGEFTPKIRVLNPEESCLIQEEVASDENRTKLKEC